MMQIAFVGFGAGVAAALLFASVTSGSWLSIFLFYLAPLPMMIAGVGWSHWAALLGAVSGALALGAVFSYVFFFAFLAGAGIPAWWLSYLALLARPAQNGAAAAPGAPLDWYPPGRLVLWAALLGALVVIVAIPNFGLAGASFHENLVASLTRLFHEQAGIPADAPLVLPGVSDPKRLIEFLAEAIPPAAALVATITNTGNLWLAARVVKFSGRLARPWPALSEMRLPRPTAAALVVAIGLSFIGGLLGIVAGVVATSLLMAFGFIGFAIMHAITRNMAARPFVLTGTYAAVFIFGWPVLALCLLGLMDTILDFRGRLARKAGRPHGHND